MKKKWMITAVLPLLCLLTSCGRTKINVNNYFTTEISGYNGAGTVGVNVDLGQLVKDNYQAFGLKDGYSVVEYQTVLEKINTSLKGDFDKSTDLSNGDAVKFAWDAASLDALEKEYSVDFEMTDVDLTVSGLQEVTKVDPFEKIQITYTGIAPKATATVDNSAYSDLPMTIMYEITPRENLKNGDTIKVSLQDGVYDRFLSNGYLLTETEKEFNVEGLDSYIGMLSELPSDADAKMNAHAQDLFKAYVAKEWSNPDSLKEIKLLGNYLLTPKDATISGSVHNQLVYVYQITTSDDFSYYYYTEYPDVMLLADGTCSVNLNNSQIPNGSVFLGRPSGAAFEHNGLYYIGYENIETLFSEVVTTQIGSYQYETTVP